MENTPPPPHSFHGKHTLSPSHIALAPHIRHNAADGLDIGLELVACCPIVAVEVVRKICSNKGQGKR